MENTKKPICLEHPNGAIMRASQPATNKSVWVCLTCGKRLGDAGVRETPVKEDFTIS